MKDEIIVAVFKTLKDAEAFAKPNYIMRFYKKKGWRWCVAI
jgi:hypothetical protein